MQTYTTFRIYDAAGGGYTVNWQTNDNDDDGYPDGYDTKASYKFPTLEKAVKFTGITRTGYYGQPVQVFLHDKPLRAWPEGVKHANTKR